MEAPWLNELEDRVRQAIKLIEQLRDENARLQAEVAELKEAEATAEDNSQWEAERVEVRERVEALAEKLETLLNAE